MLYPYWSVQFSPEVREAEHVLDRIEELAKEHEDLLRDLKGVDAKSRAIHLEIPGSLTGWIVCGRVPVQCLQCHSESAARPTMNGRRACARAKGASTDAA
jgi:hypothetical protein